VWLAFASRYANPVATAISCAVSTTTPQTRSEVCAAQCAATAFDGENETSSAAIGRARCSRTGRGADHVRIGSIEVVDGQVALHVYAAHVP